MILPLQSVAAGREEAGHRTLGYLVDSPGRESEWQRVNPQGEELSILTPVAPTILRLSSELVLRKDGERILEQRGYGAYADGFGFAIESYRAARPQKLLLDLESTNCSRMVFEREVLVGGVSGKQYRDGFEGFHSQYLSFVTKQHVYLITLASREDNNPSFAKFLSGLMLGDKITSPATGNVVDMKESEIYKNALSEQSNATQSQDRPFSPRDVSRKATIIWRPAPEYTEEARQNQIMGTVVLRGVFEANGQVSSVRVVTGLKDGLTGKAVEAALSIRFLPAEKDNVLVSQYIQIEYNFNLY
jgi:TonB family protein